MALNGTVLVDVYNIAGFPVGYELPELNISRTFNPREVKKISVKELRALEYARGGRKLLTKYLAVHNEELLEEFGMEVEAEYYWTEDDVRKLLLSTEADSLPRLQDALEFAPAGIVEVIKRLAVEMEINDMSKRQAIIDATGFNVNNAIRIQQEDREGIDDTEETPVARKRRVQI